MSPILPLDLEGDASTESFNPQGGCTPFACTPYCMLLADKFFDAFTQTVCHKVCTSVWPFYHANTLISAWCRHILVTHFPHGRKEYPGNFYFGSLVANAIVKESGLEDNDANSYQLVPATSPFLSPTLLSPVQDNNIAPWSHYTSPLALQPGTLSAPLVASMPLSPLQCTQHHAQVKVDTASEVVWCPALWGLLLILKSMLLQFALDVLVILIGFLLSEDLLRQSLSWVKWISPQWVQSCWQLLQGRPRGGLLLQFTTMYLLDFTLFQGCIFRVPCCHFYLSSEK